MKLINTTASFFKSYDKTYYLLLLVLLVGTFLRVHGLSSQFYWYDEIITLEVAYDSLGSIITGNRPPLYLALAHFWIGNFGHSEVAARLLSVIFGIASIILIYVVGKRLFDRKIGVVSALLMSVSVFQIHYSQELRYYSLFEFMTLVSFYFYILFLRSKSYFHAALYILSTILLYYSHDFGIFIIAVQNLYLLMKLKTLKPVILKWVLSQLLIILGIAPRFLYSFGNKAIGEGGPNWISPPGLWAPLNTIKGYMSPAFGSHDSTTYFIAVLFLLIGTLTYILFAGKEKWLKSLKQLISGFRTVWKIKSETLLVALWLFVPILLVLLMSEVLKPMYLNRYLICSAPACYILAALLLAKLNKVVPVGIILIAFLILISPGLYNYHTKPSRKDWREVGSYIKEQDRDRTSVVLISFLNFPSFNWYNRGNFKYCRLPKHRIDHSILFKYCALDNIDHFWVVLGEKQLHNSQKPFYQNKNNLYRIAKEKEFVVSRNSRVILYSFQKVKE